MLEWHQGFLDFINHTIKHLDSSHQKWYNGMTILVDTHLSDYWMHPVGGLYMCLRFSAIPGPHLVSISLKSIDMMATFDNVCYHLHPICRKPLFVLDFIFFIFVVWLSFIGHFAPPKHSNLSWIFTFSHIRRFLYSSSTLVVLLELVVWHLINDINAGKSKFHWY